MYDADAVTDLDTALGAVERAACDRLRLLARDVFADEAIVEIGSHRGRSTAYLALGAAEGDGATVHAVDPWTDRPRWTWPINYEDAHVLDRYADPASYMAFKAHLVRCGLDDRVVVHRGYATDVAKDWDRPIGLLFHDGPHAYQEVYDDLVAWRDHVAPGGTIVIHDAGNRSFGVYAAAHDTLRGHGFDWDNRVLDLWIDNPGKRGTLTVQRVS